MYVDLHGLTARLLHRGVADGSLQASDPVGAAVAVIALLDGLVVQCYLPGARLTPRGGRAILRAYLRSAFGGRTEAG